MTVMTGGSEARNRFDLTAILAIVVTIVFWASSFVVIRVCLGPLTPVELATVRHDGRPYRSWLSGGPVDGTE